MPARKKLNHDDKTREKIKTSQLINRLTDHALGDLELSATQIRAMEILIKKTLPDLQSIEQHITGSQQVHHLISDQPMSEDDWEQKHSVEPSSGASESIN